MGLRNSRGRGKVEDLGEDWSSEASKAEATVASRAKKVAQQRESATFFQVSFLLHLTQHPPLNLRERPKSVTSSI